MNANGDVDEVTIIEALAQAALDSGTRDPNRKQLRELSRQAMAERAGGKMSGQRVGQLRSAQDPKSPSLTETVRLASATYLSLEQIVDRRAPLFPCERNGIAWRLSGVPQGTRPSACRIAVAQALAGESLDTIRTAVEGVYIARHQSPPALDEVSLRDMVQAGLDMGLARFESPPGGTEEDTCEDPELASELARSLQYDSKARPVNGSKHRPRVRVVKNVTHASFALDPITPFLIARLAHRIVASHLREHPTTYYIGLAGGMHCSTFVRSTGAESSPFPDDSGDKQITFVPLTLEPFWNHQLPMADAVVGQMVAQARALLGARRVNGLTLQSFGYVTHERISRLDDAGITHVRQRYRDLDVAIFGCGDLESDGWLEQVIRRVTIDPAVRPATDVCLNMLAEDGTSIQLSEQREFVGISLADIRRLVPRKDGLALLLTSGRAKGRPIVVASRAGCTDTIVCDQSAATAALEMLAQAQRVARLGPEPRAAPAAPSPRGA